jgi:2-polyprenyl-6-methoxyphenol hydroxylase-like FAD-dependent oxidoreductase
MKILIAGGEPTGAQLAAILLEQGHTVNLIEHRRDVLDQLHQEISTKRSTKTMLPI